MPNHLISAAHFDALAAGYGTAEALAELAAGQRSHRLVLLRAVVTEAEQRDLVASAGTDRAIALIGAAERRDPSAVAAVLAQPFFATWAMYCLRRMREGADGDIRRLNAYAAAAGIRAGCEVDIEVPIRDGMAWLPTLGAATGLGAGMALVRHTAGRTSVSNDSRSVALPSPLDVSAPGWAPSRPLGTELKLTLEDLDPYRDVFQWSPAPRLEEADVNRLQQLLDEAWTLIRHHHPAHAPAIRTGLRSLVPLVSPDPAAEVSAASQLAAGSIAIAPPADADVLASLIIHEFQHMKLGALLDLVSLYKGRGVPRYRAPWRADPRPIGALLQGAYAHIGVTDYWRVRRSRDNATASEVEYGYWLHQTTEATTILAQSVELTPAGMRFVAGMAATLRRWWETDPLRPAISDAINDMTYASAVSWRLRNLRASSGDAPEWTSEARSPAPARLPPLAVLIRQQAVGVRTSSCALGDPVQAYLAGDWDRAMAGFRAAVTADPVNPDGWIGLALACRRVHPDGPLSRSLTTRPELLYNAAVSAAGIRDLDELAGDLQSGAYTGGGSMSQLSRA